MSAQQMEKLFPLVPRKGPARLGAWTGSHLHAASVLRLLVLDVFGAGAPPPGDPRRTARSLKRVGIIFAVLVDSVCIGLFPDVRVTL